MRSICSTPTAARSSTASSSTSRSPTSPTAAIPTPRATWRLTDFFHARDAERSGRPWASCRTSSSATSGASTTRRSTSPCRASTPGAAIYYTIDGSEPYLQAARMPTGMPYTKPDSNHARTTCLRAIAVKQDWVPEPAWRRTRTSSSANVARATGPALRLPDKLGRTVRRL